MGFMVKSGLRAGTCQSEHSERLKKCDLMVNSGKRQSCRIDSAEEKYNCLQREKANVAKGLTPSGGRHRANAMIDGKR